jgi:hypothetical protein
MNGIAYWVFGILLCGFVGAAIGGNKEPGERRFLVGCAFRASGLDHRSVSDG